MNKMALIILLGLNLVVAQVFAQAYEDEVIYEEDGVEYVDEGADINEGVDEGEYIADDDAYDEAYNDDAVEPQPNTAMRSNESVDATDITRWVDSEEDIAKKEARIKRKAQQEAEYNQSIKRKRSGLFFGGGMGYSGVSNLSNLLTVTTNGVGLGVFVGYQQAFNEYSGIRFYGEFDYNLGNGIFVAALDGKVYNAVNTHWKGLGNIDFYLEGNMGRNYTETLGFFFGLGAGYMYNRILSNSTTHNYHLIAMNINFGLHTILGTHHRIELFGRLYPYITPANAGSSTNISSISSAGLNMDAWIRYSYMF